MSSEFRPRESRPRSGLREMRKRKFIRSVFLTILVTICVVAFIGYEISGWKTNEAITLTMVCGSEKRGWIEEVTPLFLDWWRQEHTNTSIEVYFNPLGSRESMIEIFTGEIKPVVWSPASSVWVPFANYMWHEEYKGILVVNYTPLVFSPIVIVTWEEYAKQHGITGFQRLHELAVAQGSDLRLAHTDPQLSNSGFMAVIMEVSIAAGKPPEKLTPNDLLSSDVRSWLTELESKAVHYGESTGFLADEACEVGPSGLNTLIMYENLVIEKNLLGEPESRWGQKLVVVYPQEGTLMSDHPFCILNAPWVSDSQRWAAEELQRFLLRPDIQAKAVKHGLRPTLPDVPLDEAIFNPNYGVSYVLPCQTLEPPTDGEVLRHITDVWLATRARG